jgi:hypothetical protein
MRIDWGVRKEGATNLCLPQASILSLRRKSCRDVENSRAGRKKEDREALDLPTLTTFTLIQQTVAYKMGLAGQKKYTPSLHHPYTTVH